MQCVLPAHFEMKHILLYRNKDSNCAGPAAFGAAASVSPLDSQLLAGKFHVRVALASSACIQR